jgi:hypothetical protein
MQGGYIWPRYLECEHRRGAHDQGNRNQQKRSGPNVLAIGSAGVGTANVGLVTRDDISHGFGSILLGGAAEFARLVRAAQ